MKLFIFGSTGDLVRRKILPSLQSLEKNDLEIFAIGRKKFSDDLYYDFACNDKYNNYFKKNIHYVHADFKNIEICSSCLKMLDKNETNYFYISTPPKLFGDILYSLYKLKKEGFKIKILMEKPFGENLEHARKLEKLINDCNLEQDIFLSDHYLFKKNTINLKKQKFDKIKITVIEKLGLEGRTTYYDDVGALKDMVQSHFFSIIFKLVENPEELKSAKVIKYVRAQYGNGDTTGYVKELGKKSQTETFIFLKLKSESKEFVFITGKAFGEKISKLEIDNSIYLLDDGKPYDLIFSEFFSEDKSNFPTISNAILSWEIIEKLNKKKPELKYYDEGLLLKDIIS